MSVLYIIYGVYKDDRCEYILIRTDNMVRKKKHIQK